MNIPSRTFLGDQGEVRKREEDENSKYLNVLRDISRGIHQGQWGIVFTTEVRSWEPSRDFQHLARVFSKPNWANPGLLNFFISVSDPATSTSLNGEKLRTVRLVFNIVEQAFDRESNWRGRFDLIRDLANRALKNRALITCYVTISIVPGAKRSSPPMGVVCNPKSPQAIAPFPSWQCPCLSSWKLLSRDWTHLRRNCTCCWDRPWAISRQ